MVVRWHQDQLTLVANHVASSLRTRLPVEKLAKVIDQEYGWTSTREIATRALTMFSSPAKRGAGASFLTIDQVCTFAVITVYSDWLLYLQ